MNLVAPGKVKPLAPEYQRLVADVGKEIGRPEALGEAREDDERQDLTLLHRATGWDARLLALAAIAACRAVGVSLAEMVAPLRGFQGVARRFQVLGEHRGVVVVDDFGHNPAKIAASLRAAQMRADRVLAVFQPHGYGPMRFLRQDFIEMFAVELRPLDRLWMLEIYYAGGTATRDISSGEIVAEIASRGIAAEVAPSREWLITRLVAEAQNGDLILVMGARDPSLTTFSKAILAAL